MDEPEVTVYCEEKSSYLRLVHPDSLISLSNPREGFTLEGLETELPDDPYEALNVYFNQFDSGIIAGWLSYDFARLNELFTFKSSSLPLKHGPMMLLAHYPGERSDYLTGELPSESVSLGDFSPVQSQNRYRRSVRNIKTLVKHGYIYQLNYSQRFTSSVSGDLLSLMASLKPSSLPPHSVHGRVGDYEFLSLSPERFLKVEGRKLLTEPIKGTRPRGRNETEAIQLGRELKNSSKDRAEHMMIVDLERNDLNQVCETGSVHVPSLARLETFPTVHHLVSTVAGQMTPEVGFGDLIKKLFPGGSITGCPKRIAVRMIDFLEGRPRGLYTGTAGYWDLNDDRADWNIAIRTLQRYRQQAWWDSGGGIVIDSNPDAEYSESLDKVELIKMIQQRSEQSGRMTAEESKRQ
ncbi:MAG: anthranilate synthase component I family protein [bacterium]